MKRKPLTYDQIAKKYKISVADVNNSITASYNKMVSKLVKEHGYDIWDVIVELKNYFNMPEKEAVEKLNIENKQLLKESARIRINNIDS
jgi:predicted DNA-binding protein (UPF0251 family)